MHCEFQNRLVCIKRVSSRGGPKFILAQPRNTPLLLLFSVCTDSSHSGPGILAKKYRLSGRTRSLQNQLSRFT